MPPREVGPFTPGVRSAGGPGCPRLFLAACPPARAHWFWKGFGVQVEQHLWPPSPGLASSWAAKLPLWCADHWSSARLVCVDWEACSSAPPPPHKSPPSQATISLTSPIDQTDAFLQPDGLINPRLHLPAIRMGPFGPSDPFALPEAGTVVSGCSSHGIGNQSTQPPSRETAAHTRLWNQRAEGKGSVALRGALGGHGALLASLRTGLGLGSLSVKLQVCPPTSQAGPFLSDSR